MTDWFGIADTVEAATAGLDLEMPAPPRAFGPALLEAVRAGRLDESRLDDMVRECSRSSTRWARSTICHRRAPGGPGGGPELRAPRGGRKDRASRK